MFILSFILSYSAKPYSDKTPTFDMTINKFKDGRSKILKFLGLYFIVSVTDRHLRDCIMNYASKRC